MGTLKVIEANEATEALGSCAWKAADGPIVVTENGRPLAILLNVENADLETISLSTNPEFIALIERSRASLRAGKGISLAEVKRRLAELEADEAANK